jgi:hypothetical protein
MCRQNTSEHNVLVTFDTNLAANLQRVVALFLQRVHQPQGIAKLLIVTRQSMIANLQLRAVLKFTREIICAVVAFNFPLVARSAAASTVLFEWMFDVKRQYQRPSPFYKPFNSPTTATGRLAIPAGFCRETTAPT